MIVRFFRKCSTIVSDIFLHVADTHFAGFDVKTLFSPYQNLCKIFHPKPGFTTLLKLFLNGEESYSCPVKPSEITVNLHIHKQ